MKMLAQKPNHFSVEKMRASAVLYLFHMSFSPLLQRLFSYAEQQEASDLHLSARRQPIMRTKRELITLENEQPFTDEGIGHILVELIGQEKALQVYQGIETDFSFHFHKDLRFRGNAYRQSSGIGIALRVIKEVQSLEDLSLPQSLVNFAKNKQGFFLIVGPTGHGKSTTMAAMIELINLERREHIVTIEHPIEFIFQDKQSIIDQREVGIDSEGFAPALRAALRQDVDVIMIGEMRDRETINAAVTAAETGHLVFSTLHTNSAAQTIDRIIDSFPSGQQKQIRTQLAGSLLGIFSQRLVPTLQGGLAPAYELLINNTASANLIREGRIHEIESVIETSRSEGMTDMNHSLLDLVRSGRISIEDALAFSNDPEVFSALM
jgi:twitching motility protein PilT